MTINGQSSSAYSFEPGYPVFKVTNVANYAQVDGGGGMLMGNDGRWKEGPDCGKGRR